MSFITARNLLCGVLLAVAAVSARADKRPFAVEDGIEMTTIVEPLVSRQLFAGPDVSFSRNGKRFFIVTSQGNIAGNYNEYKLLVFSTSEVIAYLEGKRASAEPVTAATFRSTSNRPGIWRTRWQDEDTLAFLAENEGEVSQLYTVEADGTQLRRLTNHPTPLMDFDVNESGNVVYAAIVPADWSKEDANGVVLGVEMLWDVMQRGRGESFYRRLKFFAQDAQGRVTPVEMEPFEVRGGGAFGMWLAPDGRHAVSLVHVKNSPERWWKEYEPVAGNDYFAAAGARSQYRSFTSEHREVFLQYVLIDMASGEMRPVIDAPAALYFGGMKVAAHWADAGHIILDNTFLPLEGVSGAELERRRASPAAVVVDIRDGSFQRITDLPTMRSGDATSGLLFESKLLAKDLLTLDFRTRSGARSQAYRRTAKGWVETKAPSTVQRPIKLDFPQDINTPPNLRATLVATGQTKLLTDLNPQFKEIDMTPAEVVEWRTRDGKTYRGGLVLPRDVRADRRYPLVIQTHGFEPGAFLVTGPGGSPSGFAARALAANGIVVLQTPDVSTGVSRAELEDQIQLYRSAVDMLVERGLVDPERIGIHGWSRTGLYAQHAATFSDLKPRAVTVADPSYLSQLYHALSFGAGYPGMMEQERLIGAPLWGEENAKIWAERDSILNLHRFSGALRIEVYGRTLGGWWDVYALLRRHGRPAEYVYYPTGQHVLAKPREQLNSQGGNVDWYRFWLKGEEDPDPRKAEQYQRWRAMRAEAGIEPVGKE